MRRLLDDLLWLARFDASQAASSTPSRSTSAVMAAQAVDRFGLVAETRGLTIDGPGAARRARSSRRRRSGSIGCSACCSTTPASTRRTAAASTSPSRSTGRASALTVDDSGPGIPEAERTRIFDRFHRATDEAGGAGLGLAIADAIVRATGGRWRVGDARRPGGARMGVSWSRALA